MLKFATILDAHTFANSEAGQAVIKAAYAGNIPVFPLARREFYKTPQAAALAALVGVNTDFLGDSYGVVLARNDAGARFYSADVGNGEGYIWTTAEGFQGFLDGHDWTDDEWAEQCSL